jgi:hypothetical protein
MLPLVRQCRRFYLDYFSQPASDRVLYRALRKRPAHKILELGIGAGQRTLRMLEIVAACRPDSQISYAGIDLFEARSETDGPGLSLKAAHQQLRASGAKVRLVPGDPLSALARMANEIGPVDLIVISADQDRDSLARSWFYFPRMLHAATRVFLEERETTDGPAQLSELSRAQINDRVALTAPRRSAA